MSHTPTTTIVQKEPQSFNFRGEAFHIIYHYYLDKETGETFTTNELDELNITQVHNQYRAKYGLPFTDEIKAIREQYGLSASKMSALLGFGTNGYKNYEHGEMPSIPHGRYLQLIKDPKEFIRLIEFNKNEVEPEAFEKIKSKVTQAVTGWDELERFEEAYIFGNTIPNEYSGYRKPSFERVGSMVAFFAKALQPFTTKMNKLLFYADFLHYSRKGFSITGLNYVAINYGPVPKKYGAIYNALYDKGFIDLKLVDFGEGIEGERFDGADKEVDLDLFLESEVEVLHEIIATFGKANTKSIIHISHEEQAWKNNIQDRSLISYQYGFSLKHV